MKKILYLAGSIFMLVGCEFDPSELEYKEPPFVIFTASTATVTEGNSSTGNTIKLTVSRGGTGISEPLTVNFGVVSAKFVDTNADAAGTFTLLGDGGGTETSVTIPANMTTNTISFTTKGNTTPEKNRIVEVELSSNSGNYNLGYPGPSSNNKKVAVTIRDDD